HIMDLLESYKKASIICPESEIEALGGCTGSSPEQLSAPLSRLNQRLQHESQRHPESIDKLRTLYEKKERKIQRKRQTHKAFREKLRACQKSLDMRWSKFQRNATLLKHQLTLQYDLLSLHDHIMHFRLYFRNPSILYMFLLISTAFPSIFYESLLTVRKKGIDQWAY
ncbi:hypothetical protein RJ640_022830, partial [Escallonia rubra]